MPRQTYKERERQRREQEILRVAARLIREGGYASLNMDELADEVGVSKPTLYQHFRGKEDMVIQSMIRGIEMMEEHLTEEGEGTPLERLEAMFRYMLDSYHSPDSYLLSLVPDQALKYLHENPEVIEHRKRVEVLIYDLVEKGKESGEIFAELPSVVVVGGMFSLMSVMRGVPAPGDDALPEYDELAEGLIKLYMRGVRA